MEDDQIERVRRALLRRPKPPWRVLWCGEGPPAPWWAAAHSAQPRWQRRLLRLRSGWKLLWAERVRRDLAPIYRLLACRRGRHRDAHLMADELVGSPLGQDYPAAAICEVCGRAVAWPNGTPTLLRGEWE
jgi:hypothetical protein